MRVMVVGSGGREYSMGLALKRDSDVEKIYFAPGNGATQTLGENISFEHYEALAQFAKEHRIDLTIVGPENALVDGIVDLFRAQDLVIFGATKAAARLEGSKIFMKNFLSRYHIPTAAYIETTEFSKASDFIETLTPPIVVKADGLCAGKGVIIAKTHEEAKEAVRGMLSGESFGEAGKGVVVEAFLDGYELSVFVVCDGVDYTILPAAQDHKRLLDHDEGPNTGGMGAYAPTPLIDESLYSKIEERVVRPTLKGMQSEGAPFTGVLFIGIMVVQGEPIVLEYNVRFGDPECEVLMPLLKTPASQLFYAAALGQLSTLNIEFYPYYAVAVVMASENYPYGTSKPSEIIVSEKAKQGSAHAHISYAGVSKEDDRLFATGGRVLLCVGVGKSIQEARDHAYDLCGEVHFAGKQFRSDIAYQALRA